jgi:hypothetical protein
MIVDGVPGSLMTQNDVDTARTPATLMNNNTISGCNQSRAPRHRNIHPMMETLFAGYRVHARPVRTARVYLVPYRPGFKQLHGYASG